MAIEDSSLVRIAVALEGMLQVYKEQQKLDWMKDACEKCRYFMEEGYVPVAFFDFSKYYGQYYNVQRRSCEECHKQYARKVNQ